MDVPDLPVFPEPRNTNSFEDESRGSKPLTRQSHNPRIPRGQSACHVSKRFQSRNISESNGLRAYHSMIRTVRGWKSSEISIRYKKRNR